MQTRTYGDLFKLIQSLAGVGTFATSEQDDIANFINRRFSQAFNTSPVWERYITSSEERQIVQVGGRNVIPYVETGKTTIGEFNRIHRQQAFVNNSALEYEFFVDINGANILNLVNTTDTSAFVTYKSQFTPFTTSSDYSNSIEEVPAEFFNYLAHSVYADFLRMDGQTDKSLVEEQNAASYLASELEKIDLRSNNNTLNKRFSTYVNRQSR